MECHMFDFFDIVVKFGPKMVCFILFLMKLVALKLDLCRTIYDSFTWNTRLRLVVGIVKNPNFHNL
jgi:hypothetical protein